MKGDFTRNTFDSRKRFSRVLLQQGCLLLDADLNEQTSILLHYLRALTRDLIGPHGGPEENIGFALTETGNGDIGIAAGRYYVDGILIENDRDTTYLHQADYPVFGDDALRAAIEAKRRDQSASSACPGFFIYLDVWERHVTPIEESALRNPSFGGSGTCTRAKVVWQVKAIAAPGTHSLMRKMRDLQSEPEATSEFEQTRTVDDKLAALHVQLAHRGDALLDTMASRRRGFP